MSDEIDEKQIIFDDDDGDENFIDLKDAVEVEEIDDDIPMDDDDNDGDVGAAKNNDEIASETMNEDAIEDMSLLTIASHKSSSVFSVASHFDKNSNTLSIITGGGDDKAFMHKMKDNNVSTIPLNHQHTDSVSCVATNESLVSDDLKKTPKYVAVGAYDGTIVLYNPDTGEKITVLDGPTDVEFVAFHKSGTVLLAGSIADATVWMYHLPSSKCLQVFVGHECNGDGGGVTSGAFTPDGKFALTIGMDGTMRIWAPRTGVCRHVFKFHSNDANLEGNEFKGLTCLAVDGGLDGQLAVAGGEDGCAQVVHLQGKKIVATLHHFDAPQGGSSMNIDEGEEAPMVTSVEAVGFASRSVNSNWLATGGSDGKLKVWDLTFNGGQCRQVCEVKDNECGGITRLLWHPLQPIIIASYSDAVVRLWDARNGRLIHTLTGGNSSEENQINDISVEFIDSAAGSSDSIVIVTGNDDGNAKVFGAELGAIMAQAQN